ncbi:MAG: hypothetical protein J1F60_03820 [Oscillospiraceae bacterium]|nr:hypothetical protein [Oscillospiraceae bacterium]
MSRIFDEAKRGDITAFSKIYGSVCEKIYYVAYYSLASSEEAAKAVTEAAHYAYDNAESCTDESQLKELMLKKTCELVVSRFREYKKSSPTYEPFPSFIRSQMLRLTDAERLTVMVWSVFDREAEEISALTGLALDVVTKKLESGQNKLIASL